MLEAGPGASFRHGREAAPAAVPTTHARRSAIAYDNDYQPGARRGPARGARSTASGPVSEDDSILVRVRRAGRAAGLLAVGLADASRSGVAGAARSSSSTASSEAIATWICASSGGRVVSRSGARCWRRRACCTSGRSEGPVAGEADCLVGDRRRSSGIQRQPRGETPPQRLRADEDEGDRRDHGDHGQQERGCRSAGAPSGSAGLPARESSRAVLEGAWIGHVLGARGTGRRARTSCERPISQYVADQQPDAAATPSKAITAACEQEASAPATPSPSTGPPEEDGRAAISEHQTARNEPARRRRAASPRRARPTSSLATAEDQVSAEMPRASVSHSTSTPRSERDATQRGWLYDAAEQPRVRIGDLAVRLAHRRRPSSARSADHDALDDGLARRSCWRRVVPGAESPDPCSRCSSRSAYDARAEQCPQARAGEG